MYGHLLAPGWCLTVGPEAKFTWDIKASKVSKEIPEEGICLRRFSTARTWTEANAL
jgi:hypothetical protein